MTDLLDVSLATIADRRAELRAKVAELHRLRVQEADGSDYVNELLLQFNDLNAVVISDVDRYRALVADAEREVKALALDLYRLAPDSKQVAPGVTIAIRTGVSIDPAEALRWALAHTMFLLPVTADLRALEKFVASSRPSDITAVVTETPTVRLAADLTPTETPA